MSRKERRRASKQNRRDGSGTGAAPGADPARTFQAALADFRAGRLDAAERALAGLALALPGNPDVLQLRGLVALETGRVADAAECLSAATRAQPGDAGLLNNLGNALLRAGRLGEARDAYQASLRLRPGHVDTEINLATVLEKMFETEAAEAAFRRALAARPGDTLAALGLGRTLLARNELDGLEEVAAAVIADDPGNAEAHELLSIRHFLAGDFARAWASFEGRWWAKADRRRYFTQPSWQGESLAGKSVLVWGEQGVGDEILFASMIPDLARRAGRVVVECDRRLVPLFGRSFPDVEPVVRVEGPNPPAAGATVDFQVAVGSLGRWLRPDETAFPERPGFLVADAEKRDAIRARYQDACVEGGTGLLVGVAWRSVNPRIGDDKSMPLAALAPLAEIPGVALVDLQYGDTGQERDAFAAETGTEIHRDETIDQMADLDAFAAQVAALDLVVSISNTTVHVAGALGRPAWVMLPTMPMWRWMQDREDSPWYPSLRLFRQTARGRWADVVERVAATLAERAAAGPAGAG